MAVSRSSNGGVVRRSLARWRDIVHFSVLKLSYQIVKELERLNSARLGKATLSRLPPRQRAHAVKAALEAHHARTTRCC
jgi:hypothetical protein